MSKRLYTLSDVRADRTDSAMSRRQNRRALLEGRYSDTYLLERCRSAWESKRDARETRSRVKSYCYGDQWGDVINYDGETITEREYLKRTNNIPLANNIMISILNSVVGLYAKQSTEPTCFARVANAQWLSDMMSATMQANWQDTKVPDILKHIFEDGLQGGMHFARECYEERDEQLDCWTDYCNPDFMFWEGGSDPRHKDFTLIGMLHDESPEELYFKFAKPEYGLSVDDLNAIFNIEAIGSDDNAPYSTSLLQHNDEHELNNISFDSCANRRNVRVIEVWSKESKERYQCEDPIGESSDDARFRCELKDIKHVDAINAERKRQYDEAGVPDSQRAYITYERIVDVYWRYTFMSTDGTILCSDESPYDFHSHPFSVLLYPYVNGEIHPFMGNVIDQQRYINRLIVMHDLATRTAAKGITIVPMSAIPDGMSPRDFADQFTAYDGIVFYETSRLNPNVRPDVITSNAVQIGTYELLQLQLGLVRDISNVSGALQGKTPSAGTSAARYSQETQNATTSLYSVLSDFTSFTESIARKKCSMIKQFYPDGKIIFNQDNTGIIEYDRMATRDVMYKISIKEAAATASHQQEVNDFVMQLFQSGAIDIKQMLQNVNLPFADRLLQQIESQDAQMQQEAQLQQMQQSMNPQQQAQAQQNAAAAQNILHAA